MALLDMSQPFELFFHTREDVEYLVPDAAGGVVGLGLRGFRLLLWSGDLGIIVFVHEYGLGNGWCLADIGPTAGPLKAMRPKKPRSR